MNEQWTWSRQEIREVDLALYTLLESLLALQLIPKLAFDCATTCDTELLGRDEDADVDDY